MRNEQKKMLGGGGISSIVILITVLILGIIGGITWGALTASKSAEGTISFTLPQNTQLGFSNPIQIYIGNDNTGEVYYDSASTFLKTQEDTKYLYNLNCKESRYLKVTLEFESISNILLSNTNEIVYDGVQWSVTRNELDNTIQYVSAKVPENYNINMDVLINKLYVNEITYSVGTIEITALASDTLNFNNQLSPINIKLNYRVGLFGNGTANNPYQIKNAQDLKAMAQLVNSPNTNEIYAKGYYELMSDIDLGQGDEEYTFNEDTGLYKVTKGTDEIYIGTEILGNDSGENTQFDETGSISGQYYTLNNGTYIEYTAGQPTWLVSNWTPIGNSVDVKFSGVFEGNNYTISNMRCFMNSQKDSCVGLFGYADKILVKNININNSKFFAISYNTDLTNSYASAIVGSVYLKADILNCGVNASIYGAEYIGAVIGAINSVNNLESNIVNCTSKGIRIGKHNTGGLVGRVYSKTTFDNCYNESEIIGKNFAGGLIGVASNDIIIKNCSNNSVVSSIICCGGLIGGPRNYVKITNSYNLGNVISQGISGGIIGEVRRTINECYIEGCYNSGDVQGNSESGGIIGSITNYSFLKIYNCYNNGEIISVNRAGGIIGGVFQIEKFEIKNVFNYNDVTANNATSGIVGYVNNCSNGEIINAVNIGMIKAEANVTHAGGMIGICQKSNVTIYNSLNSGIISDKGNLDTSFRIYIGGIIGMIYDNSNVNINNCINKNNVISLSTDSYSGGIVGYITLNSKANLVNNINIGQVSGLQFKGGLIGSAYNITTDVVMKNCYYLENCAGEGIYGIGQNISIINTDGEYVDNTNFSCLSFDSNGEKFKFNGNVNNESTTYLGYNGATTLVDALNNYVWEYNISHTDNNFLKYFNGKGIRLYFN